MGWPQPNQSGPEGHFVVGVENGLIRDDLRDSNGLNMRDMSLEEALDGQEATRPGQEGGRGVQEMVQADTTPEPSMGVNTSAADFRRDDLPDSNGLDRGQGGQKVTSQGYTRTSHEDGSQ